MGIAADAASAYTMEPPGFVLHAWADRLPLVSHVAAIGEFDGPHPCHADGVLID